MSEVSNINVGTKLKRFVSGVSNVTLVLCVAALLFVALYPHTVVEKDVQLKVFDFESRKYKPIAKSLLQDSPEAVRPSPGFQKDGSFNGRWTALGYWSDLDGRIVSYEFKNRSSLRRDIVFQHFSQRPIQYGQNSPNGDIDIKNIMYFDPLSKRKYPLEFEGCEYSDCTSITSYEDADVVIIDQAGLIEKELPPKLNKQIWLFVSNEAPDDLEFHNINWEALNGKVNWTWNIHADATWHYRFGHLQQRKPPVKDYKSIYDNKQHLIAWVNNRRKCRPPSMANMWAKRLQAVTHDLKVFGSCGDHTCNTTRLELGNTKRVCFDMVSESFKFYLVLEPSICLNYLSETIFDLYNDVDAIPVVRGGIDYKQYLPLGTYIDASDFPSPEMLADYLQELGDDEERYTTMLKDKDRYQRTEIPYRMSCDICKAAHVRRPRNLYANFENWIHDAHKCREPRDL